MTTLSPAEERGLIGLSLESHMRNTFFAIPPDKIIELSHQVVEEAFKRKLIYVRGGHQEAVPVMLRPIAVMPDQMAYLHFVSLTLINVIKRLPDLYIQDFSIRQIAPLTPPEEKWLWDTWGPSHREQNPVFGRMDAVIDFTSPMWKDSLHFMEANMSGVGGIHLLPTAEQILADVILPAVHEIDPTLHLEVGQDLRDLFIHELFDHAEAIGRNGRTVCFIEPKFAGDGPVEQEPLSEYYRDQHGLNVLHADPAELYMKKGEVWYEDWQVDIAYRDYEVRDLIALEQEGTDVRPLRTLFKQNRIVSSLGGEFDHKSCFEILTDPQFTQKYFSSEERQILRRHVLWTRLLSDRRTSLADGEMVSLLDYARKEQEILVMKPNRSYGGDRILIGHTVSPAEWDTAIETAVTDEEGTWVVQRLARIPVAEFPVICGDGAVCAEPFYVVMGLAPTKYGLAILGRASQKMVVNVAQRGGMCAVLIGKPNMRLTGPGAPRRLST